MSALYSKVSYKTKELPLKKEISISNHVGINLDPIDIK